MEIVFRRQKEVSLLRPKFRLKRSRLTNFDCRWCDAGKADSNEDSGSLLQQLSYRKAAMFALARQSEASSKAASRSESDLKIGQAKLGELKNLLAKVTAPFLCKFLVWMLT
jgi:hypothetical protein